MRHTNQKVKHINWAETNEGTLQIEYFGQIAIIGINEDDFTYSIVSIDTDVDAFSELINKRYVSKGNWETEDKMNIRLRDIQYNFRKIVDAETPTKTPNPELPQTPKTAPIKETTPKATIKMETPTQAPKVGIDALIYDSVIQAINGEDARQSINNVLNTFLDEKGIVPNKTVHIIKTPKGEQKDLGVQHKAFGKLLTYIGGRHNVALVGPAGSGKTTTVMNVAKALDLPFYSISCSSHTGTHDFFGYRDANGRYNTTDFRKAYENGGVFLVDEFDASNPNVFIATNQATENGVCSFPDGMIERHKDFIVIMAGNTYGDGATAEYVGRNPMDKATKDRYLFVTFDYDEQMEMSLSINKEWCKKVQAMRKVAIEKKMKIIISPRASIKGSILLSQGVKEEDVMTDAIYKGITPDEINLLKTAL